MEITVNDVVLTSGEKFIVASPLMVERWADPKQFAYASMPNTMTGEEETKTYTEDEFMNLLKYTLRSIQEKSKK